MLILYRSLYILKKKFELYKSQINQIYQDNKKKINKLISFTYIKYSTNLKKYNDDCLILYNIV